MNLKKNSYKKPIMHISIAITGRLEDRTMQCATKIIKHMEKEHGSNHTLLIDITLKV